MTSRWYTTLLYGNVIAVSGCCLGAFDAIRFQEWNWLWLNIAMIVVSLWAIKYCVDGLKHSNR